MHTWIHAFRMEASELDDPSQQAKDFYNRYVAEVVESHGKTFEFFQPIFDHWSSRLALLILGIYAFTAVFAPYLPIPGPYETNFSGGSVAYSRPPSFEFLLGTSPTGYDIFSQTVHSFRTSVIIGLFAAFFIVFIGLNIGLISGYYRGRVDSALMGFTDLVYGIPFYPFAIVYLALVGPGMFNVILVIGLIQWRDIARVTRSEVLSIREEAFIKGARASGSSNAKIMYWHILPNLVPLLVLYFVFGTVWAVLLEASISFIGLGDPDTISWGIMLHEAFNQGVFASHWWWTIPPSICLSIFILCLFIISRQLEENVGIQYDDAV